MVWLLDFPGVNSQGKNLRHARSMIKHALMLMVECYLDEQRPLPKPNRRARTWKADWEEEINLALRVGS